MLPVHTWLTGNGHGATTQKPEPIVAACGPDIVTKPTQALFVLSANPPERLAKPLQRHRIGVCQVIPIRQHPGLGTQILNL